MAYFDPKPRREPLLNLPPAVVWLVGLIFAAHVVRILLPADLSDEAMVRFAFIPLRYAPGVDGGSLVDLIAPFFGHIFLHANFFHLGMNLLWLIACGPVVARRYGGWRFYVFFFVCGAVGAAAFLAWDWGTPAGMIGASGAVSGLMVAAIRMIPWQGGLWLGRRVDFPLMPILSRPVVLFTLVWFVTNGIFGMIGMGTGAGMHEVAWQAHIGGYLTGLILPNAFEWRRLRR